MSGDVRFVWVIRTTNKSFLFMEIKLKKASMGFSSEDGNFTGISSLTKTKIPSPF